ncbi:nitrous oxide reductase accessory protein NosL [Sulfuricystis multivorans]|uniref:nitrous oxide reductase accessory protein NosL n=1 Tax=Sulfuricystis multivorans TaxID=2211108 RepID=UPI000F81C87E|nr:nitrous oxide reductase accessory protein NosL [Sulfuricystis multivorans]
MPSRRQFLLSACACGWAALAAAQTAHSPAQAPLPLDRLPKPGPKDTCPVCGMLVSKYPHWVATIVYKDGHTHFFDGAKDMFKFWFDPPKYAPNHSRAMIAQMVVTDYYNLQSIDAQKAFYVIGSDVLGPMGHEFVPLASQADAEEFLKEHKGKRILRFDQITQDMPFKLDEGKL